MGLIIAIIIMVVCFGVIALGICLNSERFRLKFDRSSGARKDRDLYQFIKGCTEMDNEYSNEMKNPKYPHLTVSASYASRGGIKHLTIFNSKENTHVIVDWDNSDIMPLLSETYIRKRADAIGFIRAKKRARLVEAHRDIIEQVMK